MVRFSTDCRLCERLSRHLSEVRRKHPDYHARPVPSFGAVSPQLLIVGLAPGMHGANRTGRPFAGDHAGILLYETLHRFGFANQGEATGSGDGLQLLRCRVTNAVRCLPPQNRPLPAEVGRCNMYLREELRALPPRAAILALGTVAHRATLLALSLPQSAYPFRHGASHALPHGQLLFDSYHCSRYNTQTGRLTPEMFRSVFAAIRCHLRAV
jgi:uracil-DNA glycosylase family 4